MDACMHRLMKGSMDKVRWMDKKDWINEEQMDGKVG